MAFGLFKRSDLHSWTELWELVDRLSGRTSALHLGYLRETAEGMPVEKLVRAEKQYGKAIRLLDTEQHARCLTRDPWVGAEQTFGRRRFVRAMQAVIAAGPDALETVSHDPQALRRYDSGTVPDLMARLVADEPVDLRTGAEGLLLDTVLHDVLVEKGAANRSGWLEWTVADSRPYLHPKSASSWPGVRASNRMHDREEYPFDHFDPDAVWLQVWADFGSAADATEGRTPEQDEWMLHRLEATARIMETLGDANPPAIGRTPIVVVRVELVEDDDTDEPEDVNDPDHWCDDGVFGAEFAVAPDLLATTPPAARTDVLTQQIARAILQGRDDLTKEAAAALTGLAGLAQPVA